MAYLGQVIPNFAVYEDGKDYYGLASITAPTITNLTATQSGAGISGNITDVVVGMLDAMEMTINFTVPDANAFKLMEPRVHTLTIMPPIQAENQVTRNIELIKMKYVAMVIPTGMNLGNIQPASPADASGTFTVRRWVAFYNGEKVLEADQLAQKFEVNGYDYLAALRAATGKT